MTVPDTRTVHFTPGLEQGTPRELRATDRSTGVQVRSEADERSGSSQRGFRAEPLGSMSGIEEGEHSVTNLRESLHHFGTHTPIRHKDQRRPPQQPRGDRAGAVLLARQSPILTLVSIANESADPRGLNHARPRALDVDARKAGELPPQQQLRERGAADVRRTHQ